MLSKKKLLAVFLITLFVLEIVGCSKTTNIFRWTHKGGSSSDTTSLMSDGQSALNSKDYNDALSYYNSILQKEPNNSEALYGKAQALVGLGGVNLADLIASVIKDAQSSTSSTVVANSDFAAFFSSKKYSGSTTELLAKNINLAQLYHTATLVVPVLKQIADGNTNGIIPADDPDVNVNLGFFMIVKAVCRFLDSDGDGNPGDDGDVIKVYNDFTITVPDISSLTTAQKQTLRDQMQQGSDDAFGIDPNTLGAINYVEVSIKKVGSPEGSSIQDLKKNIADLKTDVKDEIDNSLNPKLVEAGVSEIVWHPHASLL